MMMMKTSQSEQPVGEDEGVEGVGCLAVSHLKYLSYPFLFFHLEYFFVSTYRKCLLRFMIFWMEALLDDDDDDDDGGLAYLHLHSIGGKQSEKIKNLR